VNALDLVPVRPLASPRPLIRILLSPGDRPLVAPGERIAMGAAIVERLRNPRIDLSADTGGRPGDRVELGGGRRRPNDDAASHGEFLFSDADRRRVVVAEHADTIASPASGTVRAVRTGSELTIDADGHALPGILGLGVPTHGRLELATDEAGELPLASIDVGRAGTILVVGSRVDAETLTRARAMGVRGVVVAALAAKEERDFAASERRQRAGIHDLPPFAVLVLEGAIRRPIATSMMNLLRAIEGMDVGLSLDPPALIFGGDPPPAPDAATVRVRHGVLAGREGTWVGPAGMRRFPAGVHLESAFVRLGDDVHALPLADLERFV
jgi:hypothetical protein